MALVIIKLQIRLDSPETDTAMITEEAAKILKDNECNVGEKTVEPLAFGLKQVLITFSRDEDKGSVDELEEQINNLEGVTSCQVVSVNRALC